MYQSSLPVYQKDPAEGTKKADDNQGAGEEQDTDGVQGQQAGA